MCMQAAFRAARQRRLLQGASVYFSPKLGSCQQDKVPALRLIITEAGGALLEGVKGRGVKSVKGVKGGKGAAGTGAAGQEGEGEVFLFVGVRDDQRWARSHLPAGTPVYSREALQACILRQRLELGLPLFRA
jgi:hypothetical protein